MKNTLAAGLFALFALSGCQTVHTTQPGVVGVNRTQTVSPLVDRKSLDQQATLQYQQIVKQAQSKNALNRNPEETARVRRIADRLIPQTVVFRPDSRDWKWEVNVLSSKELNAWCMPGGKIAVYSGLIEQLKLSDDELAAVMGHEIAHALREHAWERASKAANASLALDIGGILLGASQSQMDMASLAYQASFELPNSREQETEADRIGVELAARAGYDPRAAVSLWQKMRAQAESEPPKWLSTHPPSAERQSDLEDYSQRVMPLYEQARRNSR